MPGSTGENIQNIYKILQHGIMLVAINVSIGYRITKTRFVFSSNSSSATLRTGALFSDQCPIFTLTGLLILLNLFFPFDTNSSSKPKSLTEP